MTGEGRVPSEHITRVTHGYGRFRVECLRCPFWEFYEDETTAHREAQRHERTTDA